MKSHLDSNTSQEALLRVLSAHYRSLAAAGSSEEVLADYGRLLRFLRSYPRAVFEHDKEHTRKAYEISDQQGQLLLAGSLDELEALIDNEETPRGHLEFLAINRFSVPKGSMRSYSNRRLLVDKLRNLLHNERAHLTIGALARQTLY